MEHKHYQRKAAQSPSIHFSWHTRPDVFVSAYVLAFQHTPSGLLSGHAPGPNTMPCCSIARSQPARDSFIRDARGQRIPAAVANAQASSQRMRASHQLLSSTRVVRRAYSSFAQFNPSSETAVLRAAALRTTASTETQGCCQHPPGHG